MLRARGKHTYWGAPTAREHALPVGCFMNLGGDEEVMSEHGPRDRRRCGSRRGPNDWLRIVSQSEPVGLFGGSKPAPNPVSQPVLNHRLSDCYCGEPVQASQSQYGILRAQSQTASQWEPDLKDGPTQRVG